MLLYTVHGNEQIIVYQYILYRHVQVGAEFVSRAFVSGPIKAPVSLKYSIYMGIKSESSG